MKKRVKWLRLTIVEAFPVDPCSPEGPFYAPGASWYYRAEDAGWVERLASALRADGYTVTVSQED